jgi:hypothetical protein
MALALLVLEKDTVVVPLPGSEPTCAENESTLVATSPAVGPVGEAWVAMASDERDRVHPESGVTVKVK